MVDNHNNQILKHDLNCKNLIMDENMNKVYNNRNHRLSNNIGPNKKYSQFINFFLFEFILLIVPTLILSSNEHYIEIKFNKEGHNRIIGDHFVGILPQNVFINEKLVLVKNQKVYINSIDDIIQLKWDDTISDLSYMFNNLTSISSIYIHDLFRDNCNVSYMFYNCNNLINFAYTIYNTTHSISDMRSMFYNCLSLKSFIFHDLNFNNNNMSFMFYNCQSMNEVSFDSYLNGINSMRGMFYNCISLKSINLERIGTSGYIDVSYMFYNCNQLVTYNSNNLRVNNMCYMFYYCSSLQKIDFSNFDTDSYYINMSNTFYNCQDLSEINGNLNNYLISDMNEMFFNCTSLRIVNIALKNIANSLNMSKMFYNCYNIEHIEFKSVAYYSYCSCYEDGSNYFHPNDLSSIFYNCSSLTTLNLKYLKTDYTKDISYMFYNCISLGKIDQLKFNNRLTKNMRGTFQNCISLTSLDLSNFDTPNAEIMWDMFKGCSGLSTLNLNKFDTLKVTDMESMFEGCSNLTSLSLNSFKTPKVHYMNKMFKDCVKLETLDFRYISSESLGTMQQMFYNCISLNYINLFSLTENIQSISEIFKGASENFTICIEEHEKIPNIFKEILDKEYITRDCSINCYIDKTKISSPEKKLCCDKFIYNGDCVDNCPGKTKENEKNICEFFNCSYYDYTQKDCINFEDIPEGYYLNSSDTIDKCNENCKTCKGKSTNCLTCDRESLPFLYSGLCFNSCDYGYYNDSGILKCICPSKECLECSEESIKNGYCISCAEGYYPLVDESNEEDEKNNHESTFIKCGKNPINYYFDEENQVYKRCYESCKYCNNSGDKNVHNCTECLENYEVEIPLGGLKNCYEKCEFYFSFDFENHNYMCTDEYKCRYPYYLLVEEIGQCAKFCNESFNYTKEFRNKCYKECPKVISRDRGDDSDFCKPNCPYDLPLEIYDTQTCVSQCTFNDLQHGICLMNYEGNNSKSDLDDFIQQAILEDIGRSFNYSLVNDKEPYLIQGGNATIYEMLLSNCTCNNASSTIDFGECYQELRDFYKIDNSEPLYILKITTYLEGISSPSFLYKIYYPFKDSLEPLDMVLCEGLEIKVKNRMSLDNPDLYNLSSPLYNSICYHYSSKDGADMILDDRQNMYKDEDKRVCEDNCEFTRYDSENETVECNCEIKINVPLLSEIKIDKNKLYTLINIKKIGNFEVLKCIDLVFSKEGLLKNIGFYLFIPSIIMYFVCIYLFYKKEFDIIKKQIKDLTLAKRVFKYLETEPIIKRLKEMKKKNILGLKYTEPIIASIWDNVFFSNKLRAKNYNKVTHKKIKFSPPIKSILKQNKIEPKNEKINDKSSSNVKIKVEQNINHNRKVMVGNEKITLTELNKLKLVMKPNDTELNELDFKQARKYDGRTYLQYYYALLKSKHLLIRVINKKDYNSRMIKIFLCFCNFNISYAVNALFFNDDTMHKIYEDDGEFNFIYQLPQIIYSAIISKIIESILEYLALSEKIIIDFKKEKIKKHLLMKKAENILRILYCKFITFFIFSFLFTILFWYYLTCFCAVYRNTQFHLIKDTLIGFGTSMITPLGLNLLPGIFRIPAIIKKRKYMYTFSKFLQIF